MQRNKMLQLSKLILRISAESTNLNLKFLVDRSGNIRTTCEDIRLTKSNTLIFDLAHSSFAVITSLF